MEAGSADLVEGQVVLDKLRVVRRIGEGGLGAVYEVQHQLTRHRRALKVLHGRYLQDSDVVARFLREASAAGTIGDEHIVETFDAGLLADGRAYVLMELLQGATVADLVDTRGALPVDFSCAVLRQVCAGMSAAHAAGIVHRDLKPENLFLVRRGNEAFVKVLDFGISKFDATRTGQVNLTESGVAIGTPLYMSPEQMREAKHVDLRADLYSLGVVLYECLSGTQPYRGNSYAEIAVLVLAGKHEPVRALRADVPPALAEVVSRAMAANPDDRFASAQALSEALAPFAPEPRCRWLEPGPRAPPRPEDQATRKQPRPPPAALTASPPTRPDTDRQPPSSLGTLVAVVLGASVLGASAVVGLSRWGAAPPPPARQAGPAPAVARTAEVPPSAAVPPSPALDVDAGPPSVTLDGPPAVPSPSATGTSDAGRRSSRQKSKPGTRFEQDGLAGQEE